MKKHSFCPICRSNLVTRKHHDHQRSVCPSCGWVYYVNPLPSVAAFVCNHHNEILLIRRGEEPGKGKWALPSGFIEQDEMPEQAVLRELKEETNVVGHIKSLINVYNEPTTIYGNILLIAYDIEYLAGILKPDTDSIDVKFFPANRIPKIPFASHRSIIRDGLAKIDQKYGLIEVLKSKITEAKVTRSVLFYKGSMGIDSAIMKAANILPGEKVHVLNYNNGERLETYTIAEKAGSRKFILYGPASLKGKAGDKLCILSYQYLDIEKAKKIKPHVVILDKRNRMKRVI